MLWSGHFGTMSLLPEASEAVVSCLEVFFESSPLTSPRTLNRVGHSSVHWLRVSRLLLSFASRRFILVKTG